ncbi:MAG: hypothetical protein AABX88_01240 [Nanoarchaeota archaeon]
MIKKLGYSILREDSLKLIERYLDFSGLKLENGEYFGINGPIINISPDRLNITLFTSNLNGDDKLLENIVWVLENQFEIDLLNTPQDTINLLKLNSYLKKHYQD